MCLCASVLKHVCGGWWDLGKESQDGMWYLIPWSKYNFRVRYPIVMCKYFIEYKTPSLKLLFLAIFLLNIVRNEICD